MQITLQYILIVLQIVVCVITLLEKVKNACCHKRSESHKKEEE